MSLGADALALFDDFATVLTSGLELAGYLLEDSGIGRGWGHVAPPDPSRFTAPAQSQGTVPDGNPARLPERGMLVLLAIGLVWIAAGRRKTR